MTCSVRRQVAAPGCAARAWMQGLIDVIRLVLIVRNPSDANPCLPCPSPGSTTCILRICLVNLLPMTIRCCQTDTFPNLNFALALACATEESINMYNTCSWGTNDQVHLMSSRKVSGEPRVSSPHDAPMWDLLPYCAIDLSNTSPFSCLSRMPEPICPQA